MAILPWLSCPSYPVLAVLFMLSCYGCPASAVQSQLFCPRCPSLTILSRPFCPSFPDSCYRVLSCPLYPVLVVNVTFWLSCHSYPVQLFFTVFPVLFILSWLYYHGYPALTVLSKPSCPCVLSVLSSLPPLGCPVHIILSRLSRPASPVPAVSLAVSLAFGCAILAVMSCPGFSVLSEAVLLWLFFPLRSYCVGPYTYIIT